MKKKISAVKKAQQPGRISSRPKKNTDDGKSFPIVAIGASAGGLEAVTELLKNLSSTTGMAYVYIQHLDPSHESMLSTILSKATPMKVVEATEKMKIEPNHVYIIPPNKDMIVEDSTLKLNPRPAKPLLHMPINHFFMSLAEKQKKGAIGIVLSGTASDGTLGLRAIKIAGGLTFAQDDSAKFQSMPRAAITEGVVDLVLSPKEIATELERLSNHSQVLQRVMSDGDEEVIEEGDELQSILILMRKSTGVDFTHYKKSTIKRRVVRRMLLYKLVNLKEYLKYIRLHANEVKALYNDLLINVTNFFRDADTFEFVKKDVLPRILKTKSSNDPVRIWVPACSTGEEAYSIAMLVLEVIGDKIANTAVHIFATDLSEVAIAKARMGIYSKADLLDVSARRQQRFFTKVDNSYRIIKPIRDMCVFAPHNIFKDPPFSRIDLISCCNLMIYLDTVLQRKMLSTFHYSLNNNGYLVLGKSETVASATNLFTPLDKKFRVFARKKDGNARAVVEMTYRLSDDTKKMTPLHPQLEQRRERNNVSDIERTVDNILLHRYVPACVVVNEDFEILQFRGSTGLFLEPAPGKASLNLLKMARGSLGFELRNLIHKTQKSGEGSKKSGIELRTNNHSRNVSIEVVPLKSNEDDKHYLILFEEVQVPVLPPDSIGATRDRRIKQLEQELSTAREDMRSMIEEQEAVNEELQSANEEIVSSNEELQSINEELETSKEEVESTNEELMTINQEMNVRNDQLAESYTYAEAMLNTIREAILILDGDLRVKSANRSFFKTFQVTEDNTLGHRVYELGNGQWNIPKLRELLEDIIPNHTQFFGYEVDHDFPQIGKKVMLLNARLLIQPSQNHQLILLAIEDVTEHIVAQKIIADQEQWFRNIADQSPVMIWFADTTKARTFFNKTWLNFTGRKLEDEVGSGWTQNIHPDDKDNWLQHYRASFDKREAYTHEYRLRRADGEYRWILVTAKPTVDSAGNFSGYIGTAVDIHDKKVAEETLKESERRIRNVLESLPQIAFTMSPDRSSDYFNDAWYEFTGEDRAHTYTPEQREKLGHPDDEKEREAWKKKFEQGKAYQGEYRIRGKDGQYHWFLTRITPIKDANGQITQWIGTSTDIDEQKTFAEELEKRVNERTSELKQTNVSLERSNSELQQFAYVASHDLQEPLRKINTFSDRLRQHFNHGLPQKANEYLDKIGDSAQRMSRLIEDVLNFSKIGNADEKFVETDLNEVYAETIRDFDLLIKEKNATVTSEPLPVIHAVPVQMSQLFHNIISNALKFIRDGKPVLHITSKKIDGKDLPNRTELNGDGSYVEIIFADNGIGFDQSYSEQIFEIFQRLNSKEEYPGTGIGLALSKKIVNYHGGIIFANSKEGDGSAFHVILPMNGVQKI